MATKLSNEIIAAAIQGYEAQKQQIDAKLDELRGMLAPRTSESEAAPRKRRKRRLSPEGRRRIIEATKRRWAAVRAAKEKEAKRSASAKG